VSKGLLIVMRNLFIVIFLLLVILVKYKHDIKIERAENEQERKELKQNYSQNISFKNLNVVFERPAGGTAGFYAKGKITNSEKLPIQGATIKYHIYRSVTKADREGKIQTFVDADYALGEFEIGPLEPKGELIVDRLLEAYPKSRDGRPSFKVDIEATNIKF